MTMPAHAATWAFDVGERESDLVFAGTNEVGASHLSMHLKQALCGHIRHGYAGSFAKASNTVTFTATTQGGHPKATFTSDLIGRTIQIVGATSGGNNGYFTITGTPTTTTLTYENASGVVEAFTGSYRIISSKWASMPSARSAWKCKGSGAGSTGKGAGMDGIDRWATVADLQSATASFRSWFVFQNEITGAEICLFHSTNSAPFDFQRVEWVASPVNGFTGGTTSARPTATDESVMIANTVDWLGSSTVYTVGWALSVLQSTSGQLILWFNSQNAERFCLLSLLAADAVTSATRPWTGTKNLIGARTSMAMSAWSETANLYGTIDAAAAAGGPYKPVFKMMLWVASNGPLTQHLARIPNEVVQEWTFSPIGLFTATTTVRGRHCRLDDLFWVSEQQAVGMPIGAKIEDGTWMRAGDFLVPWNDTIYRRL
jgi:hypothetical protein